MAKRESGILNVREPNGCLPPLKYYNDCWEGEDKPAPCIVRKMTEEERKEYGVEG